MPKCSFTPCEKKLLITILPSFEARISKFIVKGNYAEVFIMYYALQQASPGHMNLSDPEHHINKRVIHSFALTPEEGKGNGSAYTATQTVNKKYSPAMRDSMTLIAGLQMGAPNGLEEIYEAVQQRGGFTRAATEIRDGEWWDKNSPFKELYALEEAGLFKLSYKEVQELAKALAQERHLDTKYFDVESPNVLPAVLPTPSKFDKPTTAPSTTPVEETPPAPNAVKQEDAPPPGRPVVDSEADPPKIGFVKPIVALLTAGYAAFAGDSNQPEGANDPDKPKGNWFQRHGKDILRGLAALVAVDMVQGMLRKQEPWTVRAFQSVRGNSRGKN